MDHTTTRLRSVVCRAEQLDARTLADQGGPRPPARRQRAVPPRPLTPEERDQFRHVLDRLLEVAS